MSANNGWDTHGFRVDEAKKYGLNKAVVLSTVRRWVEYKKRIRKGAFEKNGKRYYFAYISANSLAEQMPYLNKVTISRIFNDLESKGVIISGTFNKLKWDKTKWYTIPDEFEIKDAKAEEIPTHQIDDIDDSNCNTEESNCNDNTSPSDSPSNNILQSVENDGIAEDTLTSEEYVQSMKRNKSPHIRLIGSYFEERNAFFPDKKTAQAEVKRWTKDASLLVRYGNERVDKAWTIAKRKYPDMWNLSTVRKIIAEV